ncbi:MAG: M20/M25/M40 family metallo-hydrolase [Candidatus Amoebophilus sp.]
MEQTSQNFLFKYLNNSSPTGYEASGQKIWLEYLYPYVDDIITDVYGNAIGVINPQAEYKVVIEAHADEISWYVNYISKEGYIYVIRNGGSDYEITPSMRAKIHVGNKTIPAVFGWPAIHVREDKKSGKTPDIETAILDCGCHSDKEVQELGIHVGSVVTFDADLITLNEKYLVGRGLDNRIGGFMIAQVARKLYENKIKLPFGLYIANAVQEEVGLRGAAMVANRIKPDLAIVTDVTHDTQTPHYNKIKQGDIACGKGPVLTHAPAVQHKALKLLVDAAKNHNIPIQWQASSRSTGTDTDAFAYCGAGIPSALISLPLKYMHTTVEMVHKHDIEQIIELFYQLLTNLQPNHSFSYFD